MRVIGNNSEKYPIDFRKTKKISDNFQKLPEKERFGDSDNKTDMIISQNRGFRIVCGEFQKKKEEGRQKGLRGDELVDFLFLEITKLFFYIIF